MVVAHGLVEQRVADRREDHRLTGVGHGVAPDLRVRRWGIAFAQLLDQRDARGVAVRDHERRQAAVRLEQVDRAPVCDARHDQLRDLAERRGRVEGCAEDPAGLGHVGGELDLIGIVDATGRGHIHAPRSSNRAAGPAGCRRKCGHDPRSAAAAIRASAGNSVARIDRPRRRHAECGRCPHLNQNAWCGRGRFRGVTKRRVPARVSERARRGAKASDGPHPYHHRSAQETARCPTARPGPTGKPARSS